MTGGFEASVASSAASAFGDKDLLSLFFDIGQNTSGRLFGDDCADEFNDDEHTLDF